MFGGYPVASGRQNKHERPSVRIPRQSCFSQALWKPGNRFRQFPWFRSGRQLPARISKGLLATTPCCDMSRLWPSPFWKLQPLTSTCTIPQGFCWGHAVFSKCSCTKSKSPKSIQRHTYIIQNVKDIEIDVLVYLNNHMQPGYVQDLSNIFKNACRMSRHLHTVLAIFSRITLRDPQPI